jgi:hypothetical protein
MSTLEMKDICFVGSPTESSKESFQERKSKELSQGILK